MNFGILVKKDGLFIQEIIGWEGFGARHQRPPAHPPAHPPAPAQPVRVPVRQRQPVQVRVQQRQDSYAEYTLSNITKKTTSHRIRARDEYVAFFAADGGLFL